MPYKNGSFDGHGFFFFFYQLLKFHFIFDLVGLRWFYWGGMCYKFMEKVDRYMGVGVGGGGGSGIGGGGGGGEETGQRC